MTKEVLEEVIQRIGAADEQEVMEIMNALINWQKKRYPDYELVILWLTKYDKEKRLQEIDRLSAFLKGYSYSEVKSLTTNDAGISKNCSG